MRVRRALLWALPAAALLLPAGSAGGFGGVPAETVATETSAAKLRPYRADVAKLSPKTRKRMTGVSWHEGCPVGLEDLREVSVSYVDFDKDARQGRLVIHEDHAKDIAKVFERLYAKWLMQPSS